MSQSAASAYTTIGYQGSMTALTCKPVMAVYKIPVHHQSAPYSRTKSVHDEVLHILCATVDHLSQGCGVGIIGKGNMLIFGKLCFQKINKMHNTCLLYTSDAADE